MAAIQESVVRGYTAVVQRFPSGINIVHNE